MKVEPKWWLCVLGILVVGWLPLLALDPMHKILGVKNDTLAAIALGVAGPLALLTTIGVLVIALILCILHLRWYLRRFTD